MQHSVMNTSMGFRQPFRNLPVASMAWDMHWPKHSGHRKQLANAVTPSRARTDHNSTTTALLAEVGLSKSILKGSISVSCLFG